MRKEKFVCDCCGKKTLTKKDFYEICPVCGWEDDDFVREYPDERFANKMTLTEARQAYKEGRKVE